MSDSKPKTPRELLHDERTIAVKPVVVEALRRKHAALVAEREERTGKKGRPGSSPPILQAALILSGVLVLEKKYSKTRVHIEDSTLKGNGLTKNDIERGDKLLVECDFVVKERAGYKGAKHYVADHEAIAEQVPDLLGMLLVGASPVSDTASETGTLEGDEEDAPVSGTSVGNTIPTLRRKQDSGTASETHPLCTSYELASETIDRRARSHEGDGSDEETGEGSIDGGKEFEKKEKKGKGNGTDSLNDFEEIVRRISEANLTDADRRFGEEWSSKLGGLDGGDLARLSCSVGEADRRGLKFATKTCAKKHATAEVDLPWRYLLRSAHKLVAKRAKRAASMPGQLPAEGEARRGNAPSGNSTGSPTESPTTHPGLRQELSALAADLGADERLADADAAPGEGGEKLVVARNSRHAGQLRHRYGERLEGAGWRVVLREEMPSTGKAGDGQSPSGKEEVA